MKPLENQMKVYLRLFTIVGQFPFKITEKGIVPSTILKLYGIIPIIIFMAVAAFKSITEFPELGFREIVLQASYVFLGMLVMGATVIAPACKADLYCIMFQRFNRVGKYFRYVGIAQEERENVYPPLLTLCKQLFLWGVIIAMELSSPYGELQNCTIYAWACYWIVTINMTFVIVNCATYSHLLTARYNAINQELEKINKNLKCNKTFESEQVFDDHLVKASFQIKPTPANLNNFKDIPANIRLLQKSHYELFKICKHINDLYPWPIVSIVFYNGLEILCLFYLNLGKIIQEETIDLVETATWLKFIICDLIRIICILKAFASIEKKGNATSDHVHEIISNIENPSVREELRNFSQQLLHQKINFSTCGFFKLDMSLLVSMAGAITTYLVILLQFSVQKSSFQDTLSSDKFE